MELNKRKLSGAIRTWLSTRVNPRGMSVRSMSYDGLRVKCTYTEVSVADKRKLRDLILKALSETADVIKSLKELRKEYMLNSFNEDSAILCGDYISGSDSVPGLGSMSILGSDCILSINLHSTELKFFQDSELYKKLKKSRRVP